MRTRMRGVIAAVAVSTLSLTAAACQSSSGDDKKPATTDAAKPQGTKTEEPAATTPLTAAQMTAATVELKDLAVRLEVQQGLHAATTRRRRPTSPAASPSPT